MSFSISFFIPSCIFFKNSFFADLIDAARLFPPTFDGSARLFNLFRPEFVRKYSKRLNSDSLTNFALSDPNHNRDNEDVKEASNYLKNEVSRGCAESMIQNFDVVIKSNNSLVNWLHRYGVNVR